MSAHGADIVINELHYDPSNRLDHIEFIELYNAGSNSVDISGWYFSAGVSYTFPGSTTLGAGQYAVVGMDTNQINAKYGITGTYGPFVGLLSSDGEAVRLRNASGGTEDVVDYNDEFPWPVGARGEGSSMELIHPSLDNNLGGSWRASQSGGVLASPTPKAVNTVYALNAPPQIRQVYHSPEQPMTNEAITVTAKVTDPDLVDEVNLRYQVVLPGDFIPAHLPHPVINNNIVDESLPFDPNPEFWDTDNWTYLEMKDDGVWPDENAGDSTFTVSIPAQATNRTLVRYRIEATDSSVSPLSVEVPTFDDPSLNFACYVYNGIPAYTATVASVSGPTPYVYGTNIMQSLPVYHLLTRNQDRIECVAWQSTYQILPKTNIDRHIENWEGALVYDGEVYDHVRYRLRGANTRHDGGGKRLMRINFKKGNRFQARDRYGKKYPRKWAKININKMFGYWYPSGTSFHGLPESMNVWLWRMMGVPAPRTHMFQMRMVDTADEHGQYSGDFWGMFQAFELYDSRFLDARGLPDGNLYKLTDGVSGTINWLRSQGRYSDPAPSDYDYVAANLNASTTEAQARDMANYDMFYRYQAVVYGVKHYDYLSGYNKNVACYFNPNEGSTSRGLLWFLPYDHDLTWGPTYHNASSYVSDGMSDEPNMQQEFRNQIREFRDLLYQPEVINVMIDHIAAFIDDIDEADRDRWNSAPASEGYINGPPLADRVAELKQFAWDGGSWPGVPAGSGEVPSPGGQASVLDDLAGAGGDSTSIPDTPTVAYTGPTNYPANNLSFSCSTYSDPQSDPFAAMRWRIGRFTDTNDPLYDIKQEHFFEMPAVWESDDIAIYSSTIAIPPVVRVGHTYRVRCRMKDVTGRWSHWSEPVQFLAGPPDNVLTLRDNLRISEVMYNPPEGSDYEFIELCNTGTNPLDITDVVLADAVDFSFSAGSVTSLAANAYVLVVRDLATFSSRYDTNGMSIAGEYTGKLGNGGEEIEIQGAGAVEVLAFEYNDARGWPLSADGAGHSMVPLVLTNQAPSAGSGQAEGVFDYGGNWRASAYIGGSPGLADPDPIIDVLINEFAAHTDTGLPPPDDSDDWIELHSVSNMTLSAWYLSDDAADLKRWQIPSGTVITAGSWLTFYESTGFHSNRVDGFGLNKAGEQIFLSYLPGTDQDRVADCLSFDGQENGASWGRYPDAAEFWYAMVLTPSASNRLAAIEPVISRIMYHPPSVGTNGANNTDHEYIVIQNDSTQDIELWNAVGPWRISGIGYTLPSNTVIDAGEDLTIVSFDPADALAVSNFLATHNLLGTLPVLLGPHDGTLANTGERLALERPQAPDAEGESISWAIVDEVIYAATAPWPDASANGSAIHRIDLRHSGNDPANWTAQPAALPTPKIMLASPWTGSNMSIPFSHTATAVVNDDKLDGILQHVEFFINGTQSLGTDTVAPFEAVIDHTHVSTAGTYRVHAEVVDDGGSESSVAAVFTAEFATRVGIASPTNGTSVVPPFSTNLVAWVDTDRVVGAVTVTFFSGGDTLGVDNTPPYEITLDQTAFPVPGTYPLYAVLDDDFASSTSGVSFLTVELRKALPFVEGFEGYAAGSDLDGQDPDGSHPWTATDVVVTNSPVQAGSRAAALTSETAVATQTFNDGQTNVWTDMHVQPVFASDDNASVTNLPAGSSFAFYVGTNGQVVAYNGTNKTPLAHAPLTEGQWVRFTVHSDHTTRTWNLYLNGNQTPIATGLGFFDPTPAASYTEFGIRGAGASRAPVDSITVGTKAPAMNAARFGTVLFGR